MTAAIAVPAARKRLIAPHLVVAVLALSPALGAAATAAGAPPGSKLELGFEERVRSENWDNSTDFDAHVLDARHQLRLRTRLWGRLSMGANDEFVVGLNNESRWLSTPRVALQMDETVFETLYLEHRFAEGAALRVGRQNLMKGDGFLLMDGGALDGSRTAYFNAVDLGWAAGKSRLDLLLVSNPYRDRYLPRIHDRTRSLNETNEAAFGLYWTDASRKDCTRDLYYFYKAETGDTRPRSSLAYQGDRMFHTAGARLVRLFPHDWSVTAEFAGQAGGQRPGRDIRAWGVQTAVKKSSTTIPSRPSFQAGWIGLSGDDPTTEANEDWDPLFSRWPKWSELFIYTQASERGVAYWTNLSMWQAEVRAAPLKPLDLRVTYYRLDAFHRFPGKPSIYANGGRRGDLFQARADYRLNDSWRGHVVGEWMIPGSFYTGDDPGWFFRAEVIYSFTRPFAL